MFPAASDAVQVTVATPRLNLSPEAVGNTSLPPNLLPPLPPLVQVGPEVTPTLSVAVTVNVTVSPELLEAETDMLDGTFTVGDVVSAGGV